MKLPNKKSMASVCLLAVIGHGGVALAENTPAAQVTEKVRESAWLSDPGLGKAVQRMVDSRFMPFKVVGRKDDKDRLLYKAYFKPFPADLDRFFSYWGMTTAWYVARKDSMQQEGYQEVWHQTFRDAANTELHQVVFQKKLDVTQEPTPNSHTYNDEEHEQNILMGMLWRSEFKKLEQTLDAASAQKNAGMLKSNVLQARFGSLSNLDRNFQDQFDRWVSQSGSANAYLARGLFLSQLAWDARGDKYFSETSKQQIAEFHRLGSLARVDLNRANAKLPNCAMCAAALISNNDAVGMQDAKSKLLANALEQDPTLWAPAIAFLGTLRPEWGGSYSQMEAFIASIDEKVGDEALTEHLRSRFFYYRGNAAYKESREGARVWFEKGLNGHPYQLLVNELALIYSMKNDHKRAAELLESSMAKGNERDLYTLEALAQAYSNMGMAVKAEELRAKRKEAVERFKMAH